MNRTLRIGEYCRAGLDPPTSVTVAKVMPPSDGGTRVIDQGAFEIWVNSSVNAR
jgi:hypothetical protein